MEELAITLGCLFLAAVPISGLIALVVAYKRLGALDRRLASMEAETVALRQALRAAGGGEPAPAHSEPAAAPPPGSDPTPPVAVESVAAELVPAVSSAPAASAPTAEAAEPMPPPKPPTPPKPPPPPKPPKPPLDLDDLLWRRLPVWIGAAAFALAGVYMVKLSFDRGWIGPPVQVALGVAFGVALLFGSETLRRSSAYVAHGLAAAGVAVLYAAFYSAVGVHALIPAGVGLLLMALTTAVAVLLASRHGILVALLGLVGGFATPALVTSDAPQPAVLFGYLFLLQIALTALGLRRGWLVIPALASLAGFGWATTYLIAADGTKDLWAAAFLIASAAILLVPLLRGAQPTEGDDEASPVGSRARAGLAGFGSLGGLVVATGGLALADPGPMEWGTLALLTLGCWAVSRRDEALHGLAWIATALLYAALFAWLPTAPAAIGSLTAGTAGATVGGLAMLLIAAAWWAQRGSRLAGAWLTLGAVQAAAALLLLVRSQTAFSDLRSIPWGGVALGLGALFALLPARGRDALAARVAAAAGFALLAVPLELEKQWLTVAWAIQAAVLVWLGGRLQLDRPATDESPKAAEARRTGGAHPLEIGAAIAALLASTRLLFWPRPLAADVAPLGVSDWPILVYGTAVAAFAFAAVQLRERSRPLSLLFEGLAFAVATALVSLEVRHVFHPEALGRGGVVFAEWGAHLLGWLGLAAGALYLNQRGLNQRGLNQLGLNQRGPTERGLDRRTPSPVLALGARFLIALSALVLVIQPLLADNPLWTGETVGPWWLVDWLTFSILLPSLSLWALARWGLTGSSALDPILRPAIQAVAGLGAFAWLTLEVRHAFQGSTLVGVASNAEQWAYSAAWTLLGAGLATLAAVQARRGDPSRTVRWVSLGVLLLAIGKVFFIDTASLEGFYRVLSLLGLGVILFVLAWSYRRFVLIDGPAPSREVAP